MQPIPTSITQFFQTNHVVNIVVYADGAIRSARCFYVFGEPTARLIVLTSQKTKHGRMMVVNPHTAGAVTGQPNSTTKISGIQFAARAHLLEDKAAKKPALSLYCKAHPAARAMKNDVWTLDLDTVRFTGNKLVFTQKIRWQREEG